jgi:tetratricopeptide (TPR) repeat protein
MQLNLFQWDLLETGHGSACLARLAFGRAREHFARVLEAQPTHRLATSGLQTINYWEAVFRELETLQGEKAATFFWKRLRAFSFGDSANDHELRTNLFRRLQAVMEQGEIDYLPPDLCSGYLSLQLGEYVTAENQLRELIESVPGEGLLYGYLADSLWMQGRRELANGIYAAALLLDPERMAGHAVCNLQLAAIIAKHGAALAPVYGYINGALPLVEQESCAEAEATHIYTVLRRAEQARHRADHAAMLAARKDLQRLNPELFAEYISFVQAN